MATWQVTGHLRATGAPAAAGSLIRCALCDGRGFVVMEPPVDYREPPEAETGAAETCVVCRGDGQWALPLTAVDAGRLYALSFDFPLPERLMSVVPDYSPPFRARHALRRLIHAA